MEESLISDDSDDEEDFEAHSDTAENIGEEDVQKTRTKRTRRTFKLTIELMKEALRQGGSKDELGMPIATSSDIAVYIAKKLSLEADRSLRNAVYHRLRTGKEYEKREEKLNANQKREHKAYFYIKEDLPSVEFSSKVSNSSSRTPPPTTPVNESTLSNTQPSSYLNNPQINLKKEVTNDVPIFGGFHAHKRYFHKEALDRGLNRANKIISRLAQTTGLKEVLGDLNVEVLDNSNCDESRWNTLLSWHEKYDRMKKVFAGLKDELVDGYRFVLVLNCRNKKPKEVILKNNKKAKKLVEVCEPISVGSITPHRVYNKPTTNQTPVSDYSSGIGGRKRRDSSSLTSSSPNYNNATSEVEVNTANEHWHVEIELQTLLVPSEHQGKGIGTVMQRAMYVLAQSLASEPDPPYYEDDDEYDEALKKIRASSPGLISTPSINVWQATSSCYIGRRIVRMTIDQEDSKLIRMIRGVVEAWLPAHESNFVNDNGEEAALWRIRYTTPGPLEGELEDLEEFELLNSLPPSIDSLPVPQTTDSGGRPMPPQTSSLSCSSSSSSCLCPKAELLDAEEAHNISIQRITCVTTVYLDDMAKKFYLKNDMKEMLPPYDDGMRRGSKAGCAPRSRIWDNCDHKRLHWWYNTIYGSSFDDNISPEQSLEEAIAKTVLSCN